MKKLLLATTATTALALTAGMAAADVTMSGYAEMGVKEVDDNVQFHNDIDIKFTLSGETDSGLSFGATIDLDEIVTSGPEIDPSSNKSSVFVSGDFGTLTMGDTDGAFDWAMSEIAWGTSINDDHTTHPGWNGNSGLDGQLDGQVARYDYAFGDFAVALSAEIGDDNVRDFDAVLDENNDFFDEDEIFGIGAKYSTDFGGTKVGFGLAYQTGAYRKVPTIGDYTAAVEDDLAADSVEFGNGHADIWGLSISADMTNGFSGRLNYSHLNGDGDIAVTTGIVTDVSSVDFDWDHWGVGVAYKMDALLLEANYGKFDGELDGNDFDADGFGLAANYDLGGGAVVMVGYGRGEPFGSDNSVDTWSAGVGLSF